MMKNRTRPLVLAVAVAMLGALITLGVASQMVSTEAQGRTIPSVDIPLRPGWNLISFNVFPSDTSSSSVLAPLAGQFDVALGFDGTGQSYYPGIPAGQQSLKQMDPLHGYWIRARDYVTLTIQGSLVPSDTRVPLRAGWNLIPYLPASSLPLTQALQSIAGHYSAVLGYDQGAQSYYKQIPERMNTLHNLQPGHGYWLHIDHDTYLTYGPTPVLLGVQTFGELINEPTRNRARDAGMRWPRMDIYWANIEPHAPVGGVHSYNWSNYDAKIGAMFQFGWRNPVLTIKGSPSWAVDSYNPSVPFTGGPIDTEDLPNFDAFLSALVSHYAPDGTWARQQRGLPPGVGVRYWEIFNEPDNHLDGQRINNATCVAVGSAWGGDLDADSVPDPQEYAELLHRAYPIIKVANPQAQVILGALAYDVIPEDCFNMGFLDQVLTYLQSHYASDPNYPFFDLLSFHQYDAFRDAWDGDATSAVLPFNQGLLAKMEHTFAGAAHPAIREVLATYGLDKIPLIISEVGLHSDRSTGDDAMQARRVVHAYVRARTLWPDQIFAAMWFTLQSNPFALVQGDTTATPYQGYYAYKWLGQELDGYQFDTQSGPEAASAGGTGSVYVQAYRFQRADGQHKLVLWTDDGKPLHGWGINRAQDIPVAVQLGALQLGQPVSAPLTLRVVDSTSYPTMAAQTIQDGGSGDEDHATDGWITLTITQNPIYVEPVAP